jgi:hypothetical protein
MSIRHLGASSAAPLHANGPAPEGAPAFKRPGRTWLLWGLLTLALIASKAAWLLADPTPMLFLGDSESYLATALDGWMPPDRSFVYGELLRLVAVLPHSLAPLLVLQVACSVVAALLLASALRNEFGVAKVLCFAAALAWAALEPVALLYERYLMAEAVTLPLFAAFVISSLRYLRTRDLRWLALAHVLGVFVLALRYAFVPIAWVAAIALPLIAFAGPLVPATPPPSRRWRRLAVHLAISVLLVGGLHHAYKVTHGKLAQRPPAYQYADGLFLAAAWAPLLQHEDFGDPLVAHAILDQMPCALVDRHLREAQRWYPGCLISRIETYVGSGGNANALARSAALSALRRDPLGVALLALRSWGDWFDRGRLIEAMHYDRGEYAYSEHTLGVLRDRFGADAKSWPALSTPTNRWFFAAIPWLMFLAASPLLVWSVIPASSRGKRRQAFWIALLTTCLVGASIAIATKVVPRYMHVVAWLMTLGLAVVLDRWTTGMTRWRPRISETGTAATSCN